MLLGRDHDLDVLSEPVARADRPLALYGEAGVGKTSLLRAALAASGRLGFEAGCLATLSWMPYLPLHRAFGHRAVVHRAFGHRAVGAGAVRATGSRPGRWAVLTDLRSGDPDYVAAEVESAVGDGVLVIDDAQWADPATLHLIPLLTGRIRLLAAIRRADPGAARALAAVRDAGFDVHELEPLPEPYAAALARRVRPDLGAAAVAGVVARSGGNPLLVEELAETGVAEASLQLALAARMRRLPDGCRDMIWLLALAGKPLPAAVLGDAADAVLETGLLARVGDRVTLRHGLLAEVAAAMVGPDRRRDLHHRIAAVLVDPGEAARHLLAAGDRAGAHDAAMRAARAATSPGERAQHLGLAASCLRGADAARLRLDAAEQLAMVGQYAAAAPLLDGLDEAGPAVTDPAVTDPAVTDLAVTDPAVTDPAVTDPVDVARVAAIRLRLAYEGMDRDGCRAALARGVAAAAGTDDPIEVRMACEEAFVALMVDFDAERSVQLARRAVGMAEGRGVHRARARYILGTSVYISGGSGWEESLTAALDLARKEGELAVECAAGNNLITAHESSGIPERGREIADRMIERAEQLHLDEWRHQYEAMRLNLAYHAGDYPTVLSDGGTLLAEPLRPSTRRQVRQTVCLALVDTGRIDDAYAMIEAILAEQDDEETFQESVHAHQAEALLADGKPARALALWPAHRDSTTHMTDLLAFSAPTFAWAALLAGEPVPDFGEIIPNTRMCQAGPVEVAGIRALQAGDPEVAAGRFAEAAETWQPYNLRNYVRCAWAEGEALRRAGRADRAVTALLAAERLAAEHDMAPLLGQIRGSLRAAGVPRSAARETGRRDAAGGGTGPAGLSGREREVLTLVAQGLSDAGIGARLGISPRTVESQLASARRKLGARTRHQAAAMVTAR